MNNSIHQGKLYQGNMERHRKEQRDMAQAWMLTLFSGALAIVIVAAFFALLIS